MEAMRIQDIPFVRYLIASSLLLVGFHCPAEVVFSNSPASIEGSGANTIINHVKKTVARGILSHLDQDTSAVDQYMACNETSEIPGFYICVAFYQADLNDAFTRAGIYMGAAKGMEKGTLLKESDWTLKNYKKLVAGHNLPGDVVRKFYRSAMQNPDITLNTMEAQFYSALMSQPQLKNEDTPFYIVGLSVQSTKPQQSVLSHEIYHAQYLLTKNYKSVVDRYWKETVTDDDKDKIRAVLGRAYNTEDYIIVDEFQAYLLQDNADKDMLKDFLSYREGLEKELVSAGVDIIRVNP